MIGYQPVKRRQRTHAASGGASEALPHEVGARPSRSEPKLNTHALYPSRSELRGITFKNKTIIKIFQYLQRSGLSPNGQVRGKRQALSQGGSPEIIATTSPGNHAPPRLQGREPSGCDSKAYISLTRMRRKKGIFNGQTMLLSYGIDQWQLSLAFHVRDKPSQIHSQRLSFQSHIHYSRQCITSCYPH